MNHQAKNLLIFDLDGTLIDSVPDLAAATNAMLRDLALPTFDEDQIRHWVGNGAKVLVDRALSGSDRIDPNLSEDLKNRAQALFYQHYRTATCVHSQAYDGVDEGLKTLQQAGYILALVTNKPSEFIPTILAKMGWQDRFVAILGGDTLSEKKPSPLPLSVVCDTLSLLPSQGYMIGDSKNDVIAGKRAGMTTLALTYGYNYGEPIALQNPDRVFDRFADLVAFLLAQATQFTP